MYEKSIETIVDESSFHKLLNNFSKSQPFIKTNKLNIEIEFIDYLNGEAIFRIPNIKSMPEKCVVFVRSSSGQTIYAFLKLVNRKQENIFIFHPIKMQVVSTKRKEERENFRDDEEKKKILFITNIMSDFMIKEDLARNVKKVERVDEHINLKLGEVFDHVKVFFIHHGIDPRMKYFKNAITPLFIQNTKQTLDEVNNEKINNYLNEIYYKDIFLKKKKQFISEISVPILFRGKIPYGFIQVNSKTQLQKSSISLIKKTAISTEEILQKNCVFSKNEDKLLVSDLSKTGVGVVFKNKSYLKYFKEGCLIYFDLLLHDNKRANIMSVVRNITGFGGSTFKVGCEIKDIDALSEVYYDEFLESVGLPIT